jgi:ParB/RepB/Spo0J family partition protein
MGKPRASAATERAEHTGHAGSATGGIQMRVVPLEAIVASSRNPRRRLANIDELAASIQAYGMLQPVVVRPKADVYEVIAGHRRLDAARVLGWTELEVAIRDDSEDEAYILTLVENLQRDDLSPREEAGALEVLVRERGWTTVQVAAAVKRSQAYVSKRLRVFEDPIIAPAVLANKLTVSTAEELLGVTEQHRYELLQLAVEQHWDRALVRAAVRRLFAANRRSSARRSSRPSGLTRRLHEIRMLLRDVHADDLTDHDRRELRLLFSELAMLARAKPGSRQRVFPPLPAS